jgi:hypothetical protein
MNYSLSDMKKDTNPVKHANNDTATEHRSSFRAWSADEVNAILF